MTRNTLIVLVGITLCVCSPFWSGDAASLPVPKSIFADWMSNEAVCIHKQLFYNSSYVKICDRVNYPINNTTPVNNQQEFLCLGVYDRIMRLCELDSKAGIGNIKLPENSLAFDKQVEALLATKDDEDVINFCISWKNPYPPKYNKIKMYVSQLDEETKNSISCIKVCTDSKGHLIPLCSVLNVMDNISLQIVKTADVPAKKPLQETTQKANTAQTSVKTQSAGAPVIQNNVKEAPQTTEVKTESVKNVPASGTQKDVLPNNSEAAASLDVKPQESQPEVQKPVKENSQPEIPSGSQQEVTQQKENVKKVDEKKEGTAKQSLESAPVDSSKDKKVDVQPPAPEKPPIDPHVDMQDRSEVEKEPENAGQVPDEPNGEISQHTQDRDNEDAGEDLNEMDVPLPIKDEVEESPALPSEKQDFRPRMTSLRNDDESHFFGYFTVIGVICIAGYVGYHNKQKILAMVLEGRRSRGGRGRRRPSTANYRKLDCTLEEAVTSQCSSNVTHVIY